MYLSMSGDSTRLVSHSYTWASTAAYLTGTTPTILLLVAAVLFISAMLYMTYTDHTHIDTEIEIEIEIEITEGSVDAANTVASTWKETKVLLPMLRILILVIFVWGVPVAVNFGYLQVRLYESEQYQTIAEYCVSVFKLVWTSVMSSKLSNSKMLLFGLDQKEHAQFLEKLGGSKLQFNFIMNATALFMIPIMMQMVVDPACFHNVFISQDPATLIFNFRPV